VPVRGNVICGGYEKVIYRADWSALDVGSAPHTMRDGERVADELDVADLISERDHGYLYPHPSAGFVEAKVLPSAEAPPRDMFDAGRRIPGDASESFRLQVRASRPTRLIARTAPEHDLDIDVTLNGEAIGSFHFGKADGWREASLDVPALYTSAAADVVAFEIKLRSKVSGWANHHVWAVQAR